MRVLACSCYVNHFPVTCSYPYRCPNQRLRAHVLDFTELLVSVLLCLYETNYNNYVLL